MQAAKDRQERRVPATDRRPVSRAGSKRTPPGGGDNVFVHVSHSHHKTSRLCLGTKRCWTEGHHLRVLAAQEEQGWRRARFVSHMDFVLFIVVFILPCEQAIIAAAGRKILDDFRGFTVVVVTFFVKILDDVHDFVSECVSFQEENQHPVLRGQRFSKEK